MRQFRDEFHDFDANWDMFRRLPWILVLFRGLSFDSDNRGVSRYPVSLFLRSLVRKYLLAHWANIACDTPKIRSLRIDWDALLYYRNIVNTTYKRIRFYLYETLGAHVHLFRNPVAVRYGSPYQTSG
jgi:hypothetical protein